MLFLLFLAQFLFSNDAQIKASLEDYRDKVLCKLSGPEKHMDLLESYEEWIGKEGRGYFYRLNIANAFKDYAKKECPKESIAKREILNFLDKMQTKCESFCPDARNIKGESLDLKKCRNLCKVWISHEKIKYEGYLEASYYVGKPKNSNTNTSTSRTNKASK